MNVKVLNDKEQRRSQDFEFGVRAQRDKTGRLTEDLDIREESIRETKKNSLLQRPFTLYEILFFHEKAEV